MFFTPPKLQNVDAFKLTSAALASFMSYQLELDPAVLAEWGMTLVHAETDPNTGLQWAVYRRSMNNREEYILVFTGTNEAKDWITNLLNGVGNPDGTQYAAIQAVTEKAQKIAESKGGAIGIITGHSLGGGLATLAAIVMDRPEALITFNPAWPHENTVEAFRGPMNAQQIGAWQRRFDVSQQWFIRTEPLQVGQKIARIGDLDWTIQWSSLDAPDQLKSFGHRIGVLPWMDPRHPFAYVKTFNPLEKHGMAGLLYYIVKTYGK